MSTVTTDRKASFLSRAGRWMAELVLIFVGVYAAFWLSNYQQHRQDAGRRDRILASIEQTLRQGIESGKINRVEQEREAAEFRRALDAGEMPPLHPFVFTTDYSPGDFATLLQSGLARSLRMSYSRKVSRWMRPSFSSSCRTRLVTANRASPATVCTQSFRTTVTSTWWKRSIACLPKGWE